MRRSTIVRLPAVAVALVLVIGATLPAQQRTSVGSPAGPSAQLVALPYFAGAHAIWGATGQDANGHIWFGVTSGGVSPNSAHLFEYAPETSATIDRGDVVTELGRAGLLRAGEQQAKIHSKIVQGPGRYLYFASMDEDGEKEDGSRLPTWGGHLWRISLATHRWEHLLRTDEALIAVGTGGGYVYALGYFGHVLYQYDIRNSGTRRLAVGSVAGHISRNLLVDRRGHAYVPRLANDGAVAGRLQIELVEIGIDLSEVARSPLDSGDYLGTNDPTASHGIVGLQMMGSGSIYFSTHAGVLFQITPPPDEPVRSAAKAGAAVRRVGWLHPDGGSYAASLFTSDGVNTLMSVARRPGNPWEWLTCDMRPFHCAARVLSVPGRDAAFLDRTLLYGSATRDARGGHYVVGIGADYRPIAIRIEEAMQR